MALLAQQVVALSGLTPTYSAAAASTTVTCGERSFLHVKNTATVRSMTVTITCTGQGPRPAVADLVVTVPATTGDKMIGPITGRSVRLGRRRRERGDHLLVDDQRHRRQPRHLTPTPVLSAPSPGAFFMP
jgi:hypothetical protein